MDSGIKNHKRRITMLFMGICVVALLILRFLGSGHATTEFAGAMQYDALLMTIISALVSITAALIIDKKNFKYIRAALAVVAFLAVILGLLLETGAVHILFDYEKYLDIAVLLGIAPISVAFHSYDSDAKKQTLMTILTMTVFVVLASMPSRCIFWIYALLIAEAVLICFEMRNRISDSIPMLMSVVIIAVVATIISYVMSGCSSIENFIIYQYEPLLYYVDGPWESIVIFDGTLSEAISGCGLFSGAAPIYKELLANPYVKPVAILLEYGWALFIVQLAASIGLIITCAVMVSQTRGETSRRFAFTILTVISVVTVSAYLCLPYFSVPLCICESCFDFAMLLIAVLTKLYLADGSDKGERTADYDKTEKKAADT